MGNSDEADFAEMAFLDYLQLTTRAMLSEFARQIQTDKDTEYDSKENDNYLKWLDIWDNIDPKSQSAATH